MKVERFIKEYANYRLRELEDFITNDTDTMMEKSVFDRMVSIKRIVQARERELITVREAMEAITNA